MELKKYMTDNYKIIAQIFFKCKKDDINSVANQLTYKILLSLFPFIIFLMTLIAFFNLDQNILLDHLKNNIPLEIINLVNLFISEVVNKKSPNLLSWSLLLSLFNASSGFSAIIKCINKIYKRDDQRNFLLAKVISIICVIIFALSLVSCIVLIVSGNKILFYISRLAPRILKFASISFRYGLSIILLSLFSCIIYKFALSFKIRFLDLIPGSIFCSIAWILISLGFNFYINNFSRYSTIYGSIGSIFILMLWLNLIINILLIGAEINYCCDKIINNK